LFQTVDNKWKLFQAKQTTAQEPIYFPLTAPHREIKAGEQKQEPELETIISKRLLKDHTPPCVVVDKRGDILYIHGRTGQYLEPAAGKAYMNVFAMAREGLKYPLQILLRRAAKGESPVERNAQAKQNGAYHRVNLEAIALADDKTKSLFMILFHPLGEEDPDREKAAQDVENGRRAKQLEQELRTTEENVRTTIEELETSNEELKSANEEHQSTNEELQSANEELNSSKEELQSLNEELETVNRELEAKNEELYQQHQNTAALLSNLNVPILFLDRRLQIMHFSNTIDRVLSLRESDIGRPVDDMASKLIYPEMITDIREVLSLSITKEIEAQTQDGRWFLIRISPHQVSGYGGGVMVSFMEISRLRAMEEMLENTRSRLRISEGMMDTMDESFILLDRDMRVLQANPNFCKMFNVTKDEIEGEHPFSSQALGWGEMKQLRGLLERTMQKKDESAEVVNEYTEGKDGKKLRFSAQAMVLDDGFTKVLLNVRERK